MILFRNQKGRFSHWQPNKKGIELYSISGCGGSFKNMSGCGVILLRVNICCTLMDGNLKESPFESPGVHVSGLSSFLYRHLCDCVGVLKL